MTNLPDFFTELTDKKIIQVQTTPWAHRALQLEAAASGVTQGRIIQILLGLMNERVKWELGPHLDDLGGFGSASYLELFVLLNLFDMGLLTDSQFDMAVELARADVGDFDQRISSALRTMAINLRATRTDVRAAAEQMEAQPA